MPGLVGIIQRKSTQDLKPIFDKMLASMQRGGRFRSESRIATNKQWALGRVHLGFLQPASQLAIHDSVQAFFHGDLSNEAELRKQFEVETDINRTHNIAGLIQALYRLHGNGFVSRLRGSFCAVVLDEKLKRVVLVNDYLGSYPLYWFSGPQRFVFGGDLKAILQDPAVSGALNPRAVADYLTFGFLFCDKTLASQVQLLAPASTLTYDWEDGRHATESYASIKEAFRPSEESQSEYMDKLFNSFNCAVRRSFPPENKCLVSLSGGLDSRAILSAIDCSATPISTYTLGVKGCADEVIAKQLSGIAGARNRFLELGTSYLSDVVGNMREMVARTDGMYLTHGLTEMLVLKFLEDADFSVLMRGHGGELAKTSLAWPLHTDGRIFQMQSKDEFVSYVLARVNYISRGVPPDELFTSDWWAQIKDGARQSLENSVSGVNLLPPDLCSYLYLTEHHRRFTIASLELFRSFVEVRMPFVDEEFLRVLFSSPASWRDGTDIHRAIIGANAPALLRVRNSNTGAPGDAGPLVEKLWDKINTICRRLNLYGYRHYHSFERWMKKSLLTSVEQVVLHPRCLARGMYREAGLRRLIEETRRGVADRAYLLQILLILELWQQENEGAG